MIVALRKLCVEDVAMLHRELGCDPDMGAYTGWNPYCDVKCATEFVVDAVASFGKTSYSWIVMADGKAVGTVSAYDCDSLSGSAEIGYSIFASYQGNGYAKQAVQQAIRILLREGFTYLTAWTAAKNIASVKVLEACGMRRIAEELDGIEVGSASFDKVIYALEAD